MTVKNSLPATPATPAPIFDSLTSSYDQVYSQGTLQTDYVRKLISRLSPGSSVLDIGCATGVPNGVLMEHAGLKITGFDISEKMLQEARKNVPTGTFFKADAKSFLPDEKFDAIVCTLALLMEPSVWNNSLAYKISSWLKPNGLLLFGTIDFNDFPVAPGCPVDHTGLTFYHTFMGTTIKDSTFEAAEWIKNLRRAGLELVECEQRKFDPKPGEIEPEPQCYFLASKTKRHALLGPYMHPYEHYSMPATGKQASWDSIKSRCTFDFERQGSASGVWKVTPEQLKQRCPPEVVRAELEWTLDLATEDDVVSSIRAWAEQSPNLQEIVLIQASPSNQAVTLVNSVARFMGLGMQHHGALLTSFLSTMGLSTSDDCVRIELLPAFLDFTDIPSAAFVEEAAQGFCDMWFSDHQGKDASMVNYLIQKRLHATLSEFESLSQANVGKVGFDCVAVTIDLRARKVKGILKI